MKYIFEYLDEVINKFNNASHLLLLLDYDGTLTPIVEKPRDAILLPETKRILLKLIKNKDITTAIISGRSLKEIKQMVRLDGIIYAGNHGLEIEGKGLRFVDPIACDIRPALKSLSGTLRRKLSGIKGAFVEDKIYTLSLHYRLVAQDEVPLIKKIFFHQTKLLIKKRLIKITLGKKVLEVRPFTPFNKGRAVLLISKNLHIKQALPIYIGDDKTDEDAFRIINKQKGISILVGKKKKTFARYYVRSTNEVNLTLMVLLRSKTSWLIY